ncbi:MAG: hypothetical protein RLZ56_1449 [Bacteroidota bacterium]|jgi:hypothetical protein
MKNKALLVGINQYPNPGNALRGCINDILDMEYFIADKNKVYAKENIKKITDKQATKAGIIANIQWLLDGAEAGDQLLFHYSGHGAQAPTLFPRLEPDGMDEIICPYDFDGTAATALRDKEFAHLFAGIPRGVHFVWISDSCHAEDLSRDPEVPGGPIYRYFNLPQRPATHAQNTGIQHNTEALAFIPPLNGALLSACTSEQLSADAIINNRFNGAFTHYLIENLSKNLQKPMASIVNLVNTDLDKNGYDQNPQIEGMLQDKTFFI